MSNDVNNETFGMSIEKSICNIYDLDNDINDKRTKKDIIDEIKPKIKKYLEETKIKPIEYIGGGYQDDFLLEDGKYLQVKTNYNNSDKVCPPKIGQSTKRTFLLNIAKKINKDIILNDDKDIKKFIFDNIKEILKIYIDAYYTSDFILYIKKPKNKDYFITVYDKINFDKKKLDECEFSFTKKPENWYESSTVKIKYNNYKYSIGEFQIHNHRDNVKFRFNRNNFHNLIDNIYNKIRLQNNTQKNISSYLKENNILNNDVISNSDEKIEIYKKSISKKIETDIESDSEEKKPKIKVKKNKSIFNKTK